VGLPQHLSQNPQYLVKVWAPSVMIMLAHGIFLGKIKKVMHVAEVVVEVAEEVPGAADRPPRVKVRCCCFPLKKKF
jgi:hypothetical protein